MPEVAELEPPSQGGAPRGSPSSAICSRDPSGRVVPSGHFRTEAFSKSISGLVSTNNPKEAMTKEIDLQFVPAAFRREYVDDTLAALVESYRHAQRRLSQALQEAADLRRRNAELAVRCNELEDRETQAQLLALLSVSADAEATNEGTFN